MRFAMIVAMLLLAASAIAQQQKPNEALNDRISTRLGALMIQNEALALQVEQLQAQIAAAAARVKALEEKSEPKKD